MLVRHAGGDGLVFGHNQQVGKAAKSEQLKALRNCNCGELTVSHKNVAASRDAAPKEKRLLDTQLYQIERTVWNAKLASRVTASIQKTVSRHGATKFNLPGINSSQSSMMNTRRTYHLML